MDIYKEAIRKNLTFASTRGTLFVDDLFHLPRTGLDEMYRRLDGAVAGKGEGLLPSKANKEDILRLAVIKDVFETLQSEADSLKLRREKKERKLRLLQLLEQKQDAALADKSEDELRKLVEELDD